MLLSVQNERVHRWRCPSIHARMLADAEALLRNYECKIKTTYVRTYLLLLAVPTVSVWMMNRSGDLELALLCQECGC